MSVCDIAFMTFVDQPLPTTSPFGGIPISKQPVTSPNAADVLFDIDVIASVLRLHDICDLDIEAVPASSPRSPQIEQPRAAVNTSQSPLLQAQSQSRRRSTEPDVFIFPPPAHLLLDNHALMCADESSLNLSNVTTETPSTSFATSSSSSVTSSLSTIQSSVVSSHVNSLSLASSTSSSSVSSDVTSPPCGIVTSAPDHPMMHHGHLRGGNDVIASPDAFSPICVSTPHHATAFPRTTSMQTTGRLRAARRSRCHGVSDMSQPPQFTPPLYVDHRTASPMMGFTPDLDTFSMLANPSICNTSGASCDGISSPHHHQCFETSSQHPQQGLDTNSQHHQCLDTSASPSTSLHTSAAPPPSLDTSSSTPLATAASTRQWERLTAEFHVCPYPTRRHKSKMADILGMHIADITRWFKNARRRYRCAMRKEERE